MKKKRHSFNKKRFSGSHTPKWKEEKKFKKQTGIDYFEEGEGGTPDSENGILEFGHQKKRKKAA
jgi:hypothetical protein